MPLKDRGKPPIIFCYHLMVTIMTGHQKDNIFVLTPLHGGPRGGRRGPFLAKIRVGPFDTKKWGLYRHSIKKCIFDILYSEYCESKKHKDSTFFGPSLNKNVGYAQAGSGMFTQLHWPSHHFSLHWDMENLHVPM